MSDVDSILRPSQQLGACQLSAFAQYIKCRTWKLLSMRTMSEDSLETRRRWCRSTISGAVQRPRKPGWHNSYTSLQRQMPQ